MQEFHLSYDSLTNSGVLTNDNLNAPGTWQRFNSAALNIDPSATPSPNNIRLPWYQILSLLREFLPLQRSLSFRIIPDQSANILIQTFLRDLATTKQATQGLTYTITESEIISRLNENGFTERALRQFQIRDIIKLLSIPNGANFSVPGAGKTTVTLAVHILTTNENDKLLVICPKSAFPAWSEIIRMCINPKAGWPYGTGEFLNLSGLNDREVMELVGSDHRYFFTNYEHFVSKKDTFSFLLATKPFHLVLDESHRMKAGELSQRGSALLSVANLPKRKDILTGTPMPQGPEDLQSQLDFLWPGSSLGIRIQKGELPRSVITGLYTRTTKSELGLPPINRHFIQIEMTGPQAALYGIVRNEALRQLSSFRSGKGIDVIKARKSVMRLLQLSSNPQLAIRGISDDIFLTDSSIINAIVETPISPKMEETCRIVRKNARNGRKSVIWTIFTQNIIDLERLLADLNPLSIYGMVKTGLSSDTTTREGRLLQFHTDNSCQVLIANPAAAGEGISLHEVCHEAIYLDRSYVSTHYLQSIDRIHRLGLSPKEQTNVYIIQSAPPAGFGSIDYSVSRRLARKIRALEQLLDDVDLHEIAFDEENAPEPVNYNLDIDDIIDLIQELEGKGKYDPTDGI
ncbi:MAG TPA: DEAD/DEAH box helicase [Puia sp.]|uniref:DEAD/DEAH box helicase n=1 Tax=Puia sp. TaxID=2045100 RepID=UPI002CEE4088|nr:DEAD/DEAH box helicase [Puia sp.]HVU95301.1 DEAD/DEAH box helicase [Puia sp.]